MDEARERLEVVAALEHGGDARREAAAAARELAETEAGQLHRRERVVDVRVEAGRDDQQVGLEAADGRLDDLLERVEVLLVARARRAAGR